MNANKLSRVFCLFFFFFFPSVKSLPINVMHVAVNKRSKEIYQHFKQKQNDKTFILVYNGQFQSTFSIILYHFLVKT